MKAGVLVSRILLLTLVLSLLSTVVQATEYKVVNTEVNAEDILKHIVNGEDIYLENCHIVWGLSVSKIKLETDPIKNLSIIKDNLVIKNSTLESKLNLSNVKFNNCADFDYSNFNNSVDFSGAYFNNSALFSMTNFNNDANFMRKDFTNSADFRDVNFNKDTNFIDANFYEYANFGGAILNDTSNFIGLGNSDKIKLTTHIPH